MLFRSLQGTEEREGKAPVRRNDVAQDLPGDPDEHRFLLAYDSEDMGFSGNDGTQSMEIPRQMNSRRETAPGWHFLGHAHRARDYDIQVIGDVSGAMHAGSGFGDQHLGAFEETRDGLVRPVVE